MTWLQCESCTHVFTDGYLSSGASTAVLRRASELDLSIGTFERLRWISGRMVDRVPVHSGRWLDVGFGDGSLLLTAQEYGFSPFGIELQPASVAKMNQLGVEARCIDITELDMPGQFRVVSMADVLEHLPYPKKALTAAHTLLQDDGFLLISTPNYDCPAWRMLDADGKNPYWGELGHFHNFSRERLYALLRECGFNPLSYNISERYRVGMEIVASRGR